MGLVVIFYLLLQAALAASSPMTSQADSSLPDFTADALPELRTYPSPPAAFWFQQENLQG